MACAQLMRVVQKHCTTEDNIRRLPQTDKNYKKKRPVSNLFFHLTSGTGYFFSAVV
jgi:hypothetical protein